MAAIEERGLGVGWTDGDTGIGPTYVFRDPEGHEMELYWESEWYQPPEGLRPALKNQAQAYPARGVCARRLDHVNYLAQDAAANGRFVSDVLGGRVTEQIMLDTGVISAQWTHFAQKSYDLVYTNDWTSAAGRLHHIAFATDTREDILRAADICLDHGVFIETGPHKHAEAERAKGQAWGPKTISTFHTRHPTGLTATPRSCLLAVLEPGDLSGVRSTSSARREPWVSPMVRGPMSGNVGNGWCST